MSDFDIYYYNNLTDITEPPHRNPIDFSENSRTVLTKRYLRKDSKGIPIEDEHEMFWRIASFVGDSNLKLSENPDIKDSYTIACQYYDMLTSLKFLPNTPTFTGAGTPLGQLAACFVLPIEDDLGKVEGGIFNTLRDAAMIQQTGGGNGFSFSRLRSSKSLVNSSMGQASGPVGFLKVYDAAFGEVAQGGTRRGANMAVLRCDHPDILKFIDCKAGENAITNFNISVGITDKFMRKVENDEKFKLIDPHTKEVTNVINARELFDEIATKAHRNGEPGVLFLDTANKTNPVPHLYTLESTNPCITADTVISTTDGPKYVKDLVGKKFTASYCYDHENIMNVDSTDEGFFKTGTKSVFKLTLKYGQNLRLTSDHQVLTYDLDNDNNIINEKFIEASKITVDHNIALNNPFNQVITGKMISFESDGIEDVYDCIIPETHRFSANGIMVHNCGEQWLGPYESCCLGSINLAQHKGPYGKVNWNLLEKTTRLSTRFLDDVITANNYVPSVPQLKEAAERCRRIGLGIMGLADLMFHCEIAYGSEEGQRFGEVIMEFIRYYSMDTSCQLAVSRGKFPGFEGSIYDTNTPNCVKLILKNSDHYTNYEFNQPFVDWNDIYSQIETDGIRNAAQTTIAPTGTISTVAGCEGYGCEPVFALAYYRHVEDHGKKITLKYSSPELIAALNQSDLSPEVTSNILEHVAKCGSLRKLPPKILKLVPQNILKVFVTSEDVSWEDHIRQQSSLQKFVDNSISKTINMPNSATIEDIKQAYRMAYYSGCKGLTIYRTGSRNIVVLETKETKETKESINLPVDKSINLSGSGYYRVEPKSGTHEPLILYGREPTEKVRPNRIKGETHRIMTPLGKVYITINEDPDEPGQPFEVFLQASKAGSDTAAVTEAIGRLISQNLRMFGPVSPKERLEIIARQLRGIGGQRTVGLGPRKVRSLPDGIAKVIQEYLSTSNDNNVKIEDDSQSDDVEYSYDMIGDLCPECGQATYIYTEGCRKCMSCGLSEC